MSSVPLRDRDLDAAPAAKGHPKSRAAADPRSLANDGIRVVVKRTGGVTLLPLGDIECLEADGNMVVVHTVTGDKHRIREALSNMFHHLQAHGFIRVHRGTVVSASAIVGIEKGRYRKAFCVLRSAGKFEIGRVEFQRLRSLWQPGVLDLQALSAGLTLLPPDSRLA
jgi:DNA-binding LytR/AlgR family response regulator